MIEINIEVTLPIVYYTLQLALQWYKNRDSTDRTADS